MNWRDRKGVVHMLDGGNMKWCDQTEAATAREANTAQPATCLWCIAERARHGQ